MPLFTEQKQTPSKPMANQFNLESLTAPPVTPRSVFRQENIQEGKHEHILIAETLPQFQPCLLLSDLILSLHQRYNSGREVTKISGFSPSLLQPLPLLIWGHSCRTGSQTHQFISQSLHNNKRRTKPRV